MAGKPSKSAAGSALSQVDIKKVTSKNVASSASKVLRDDRTSSKAKSAAGSALTQRESKGKSKDDDTGTSSGGPRKAKK
jgi:hypothetical protein